MCGEVTPTDVGVIEGEIAPEFASFFAALPACVPEHLRPAVRAQWEQEHYFAIVKAVVRRETKADTPCHRDQKDRSPAPAEASVSHMLMSPRERPPAALTEEAETVHRPLDVHDRS